MPDFTLPSGSRPPKGVEVLPVASLHEGRAIFIAIIASLLLHALIVWAIYDKEFGFSGDAFVEEEVPREYRVERASNDIVTDAPMLSPIGPQAPMGTGPGAASGIGTDKSLATTSQNLLGNAEAPAGGQPAPLVGGAEWRRASEVRPGAAGGNSSQAAPRVDLPENAMTQLPPGPKLALEYKGEGKGTGAVGGSTATGAAQEMLAGLTPGAGLGGGAGKGAGVGPGDATGGVGRLGFTDKPGGSGGGGPGAGAGGGTTRTIPKLPSEFTDPAPITNPKVTQAEHLDDDFDYAVTVFDSQKGEPYARVDITPKRTLRKLRTIPRDVVVIIDISGSIAQDWVASVTRGVRDGLSSLNEGDRFNLVFFNDKPAFLSREGMQPFNEKSLAAATEFLSAARSGGDTDVNQALARLMQRDAAVSRVYDLILISDGVPTKGVMNTRELINLITRDNDLASSIYCVGVGNKQNRQLLEFLAYRNRGFCVYADNPFTAPNTVRDLMSRLRYPIMKDIRLTVAGLNNDEVFPRDVRNIHQGETFSIFGRYANAGVFTMRLAGHNGEKPLDFTFSRDLATAARGDKQLAQDWAFWKLHHLYSEVIRQGETKELRAAMDAMKKEYGLKTLY